MFARILSVGACALAATGTTGCTNTNPDNGPTEETGTRWTMPDLVGTDLQQAQDQIQALTGSAVFYTSSHDLSGQNRNQVLDANWKVCTQNVTPGSSIADGAKVDFGVVKLEESCP